MQVQWQVRLGVALARKSGCPLTVVGRFHVVSEVCQIK
jgi:hypothetical protein